MACRRAAIGVDQSLPTNMEGEGHLTCALVGELERLGQFSFCSLGGDMYCIPKNRGH